MPAIASWTLPLDLLSSLSFSAGRLAEVDCLLEELESAEIVRMAVVDDDALVTELGLEEATALAPGALGRGRPDDDDVDDFLAVPRPRPRVGKNDGFIPDIT